MVKQSKIYLSKPKSALTVTLFNNSVKENSGHVVSVVAGRSKLNRTDFRCDAVFSFFWDPSNVVNWTRFGSSILKITLHPSEPDFIHETNDLDCTVVANLPPYWGQMTSADNNLSFRTSLRHKRGVIYTSYGKCVNIIFVSSRFLNYFVGYICIIVCFGLSSASYSIHSPIDLTYINR